MPLSIQKYKMAKWQKNKHLLNFYKILAIQVRMERLREKFTSFNLNFYQGMEWLLLSSKCCYWKWWSFCEINEISLEIGLIFTIIF